MGLFDRLLQRFKRTPAIEKKPAAPPATPPTPPPATANRLSTPVPASSEKRPTRKYRGDKACVWLRKNEEAWAQCLNGPKSPLSPAAEQSIYSAVVPCLSTNLAGVQTAFGGMFSSFHMASSMRQAGSVLNAGLVWCRSCQHPSFQLGGNSEQLSRLACSACGREWPLQFFDTSPAAADLVWELFESHSVCLDRRERAIELEQRGKTDEALALLREAEAICRRINNGPVLAATLVDMAEVLSDQNQHAEALELHDAAAAKFREIGNRIGMAGAVLGRASALWKLRRWEEALVAVNQAEDVCREHRDDSQAMFQLCSVLSMKAFILADRVGTLAEAVELCDAVKPIHQRLGDIIRKERHQEPPPMPSPQKYVDLKRGQLGDGLQPHVRAMNDATQRGDKQAALKAADAAISLLREFRDLPTLRTWLNGSLRIYFENQELVEALQACQQLEEIARLYADKPALVAALNNQAELLGAFGQTADADAKRQEAAKLEQELARLREELPKQSAELNAALEADDWNRAVPLAEKQAATLRTLGKYDELLGPLNALIDAHSGRGEWDAVVRVGEQVEALGYCQSNRVYCGMGLQAQGEALLRAKRRHDGLGRLARGARNYDAGLLLGGKQNVKELCDMLLKRRRYLVSLVRGAGDEFADAADYDSAVHAYRTTVDLCQEFLSHPPEDLTLHLDHVASLDELGITLMKREAKLRKEGQELVRAALKQLDELDRMDPQNRVSRAALRTEIESHLK